MDNVLISACLLGEKCRYDGTGALLDDVDRLRARYNLIPVCPEVMGGLPIPRPAAEILDGRVIGAEGTDFTKDFQRGAELSLALAKEQGCKMAVLKDRSPSCGCARIYDGTHTSTLIEGNGVTAQLFLDNGMVVIGESKVAEIL